MYPEAYIDYLIYFHTDRDYFECHEVLEHYWKTHDKRKIWVGFIQLAVCMYHYRRNNYIGALKLLNNALSILSKESLENVGIDKKLLINMLHEYREKISQQKEFEDMNLPIIDRNLYNTCKELCKKHQLIWQNPSNLHDTYLINKHTLRDRTAVIQERKRQKQLRMKKRRNR